MNPLLAISVGNTNIHIGVLENSQLVASWCIHTESMKTIDEYAFLFRDFFDQVSPIPDSWCGAILVSVVPPVTPTLVHLCREHFQLDPIVLNSTLNLGMPIRYDSPRALGMDRLVGAVAAKEKYGAPIIVVDFGTATTFNVVNRAGEFAGGAIAPGVNLAADALYRGTAQLPRVDLAVPPHALATNTVAAIQSGVLFGYVALVEGMIGRLRAELDAPDARVIATGGRAKLIAPYARAIDIVDAELILDGLGIIFQKLGKK